MQGHFPQNIIYNPVISNVVHDILLCFLSSLYFAAKFCSWSWVTLQQHSASSILMCQGCQCTLTEQKSTVQDQETTHHNAHGKVAITPTLQKIHLPIFIIFHVRLFLFHTHTLGCIKFSSLSVVQQTRDSMYGFPAPWLAVLQIAAPWLAGSVPIHCTLSPEHSYSGKFPFKVSPWKRQWSAKLQLPKRFQLFSCPEIALNSTLTLD